MQKNKRKFYQNFIFAFLITYAVVATILTAQFLYIYINELKGRGIPAIYFIKLIFYISGTFSTLIFPAAICTASVIAYKWLYKKYRLPISIAIKKALLPAALIALTTFILSAFWMPYCNEQVLPLLYNMRTAKPGEPLPEVDMHLFKGYVQFANIIDRIRLRDSFKNVYDTNKAVLISYINAMPDEARTSTFENSIQPEKIGLSKAEISMGKDDVNKHTKFDKASFEFLLFDTQNAYSNIRQVDSYITGDLEYTFLTFILLFSGMCIGILGRKINSVLLVIGIWWVFLPVIYITSSYFKRLVIQYELGPYQSLLLLLLLMSSLQICLYVLAKRSLKKNRSAFHK